MPERLEDASHFAVASFGDGDAVPVVDALAAGVLDALEGASLAFDVHAFEQLAGRAARDRVRRARARRIRVRRRSGHQPIRQFAGGRKKDQALGVQVEPAHGDPAASGDLRQLFENGGALARVVLRDDFAHWLVIQQDARRPPAGHPALQRPAVDLDLVVRHHALADVRRLAIDRHAAGNDQFFHIAARADARVRQHLVQLFRLRVQRLLGRAATALEQLAGQRHLGHRRRIDVVAFTSQGQRRHIRRRGARRGTRRGTRRSVCRCTAIRVAATATTTATAAAIRTALPLFAVTTAFRATPWTPPRRCH